MLASYLLDPRLSLPFAMTFRGRHILGDQRSLRAVSMTSTFHDELHQRTILTAVNNDGT